MSHLDVPHDACGGSLHPLNAGQFLFQTLVAQNELLLGVDAAEDG